MTLVLPLAVSVPSIDNLGQFVLRALAVAGGAFVGGLLIGLLVQVLARLLTTKSVPRGPLRFIRLLSGLVCGVLVAMVMFGSGGGGWGFGGGGDGPGPGKGNGDSPVNQDKSLKDKVVTDELPKDIEPTPKKSALRIEVLGAQPQPERRFYRIEGEPAASLKEVGEVLGRKRSLELTNVTIVLYRNSPDRDTTIVRDLVQLVEANGLTPDISLDPGRAP